jgi:RimJ/RimL family protein N-acetyltransferase
MQRGFDLSCAACGAADECLKLTSALPIITERLILRPWQDRDREPAYAMTQDEEVMRYLPPLDRAGSDAMIGRMMAMQAEHGHTFWALEERATGAFLGMCGFCPPRPPLAEYEIGWRLARAAWGKGFATESARAVLEWAWANRDMASIVAITYRGNRKSRALMERIGMAYMAEEDFEHPALVETDPLRPHVLYRIARAK